MKLPFYLNEKKNDPLIILLEIGRIGLLEEGGKIKIKTKIEVGVLPETQNSL